MAVDRQREPSGWAIGWTAFAGTILIMVGLFQAFLGIVAIADNTIYVVTSEWVFKLDATTWGWIHLILGLVVLLAGIGLFGGQVWARTVGVIVAVLSAIGAFLWLPYYPVWAIVILTMDVFVIWALTAHGRDIVADDEAAFEPELTEASYVGRQTQPAYSEAVTYQRDPAAAAGYPPQAGYPQAQPPPYPQEPPSPSGYPQSPGGYPGQ